MFVMPAKPSNNSGDFKEQVKENAKQVASEIKDQAQEIKDKHGDDWQYGPRLWFGVLVLFFGLFFLFQNFNIFPWFSMGKLWPLILILVGLLILGRRGFYGRR
jgi:uncharacterized membrane protein